MQNFKDLLLWQEAHKFALEIYEVTKKFPKEEIFGITSQIRRAAVSILAILPKVAEDILRKISQIFCKLH
jgi:four helix bundle protein